jgi:putative tryptophan/tyrosine transport system substrate-binding protein
VGKAHIPLLIAAASAIPAFADADLDRTISVSVVASGDQPELELVERGFIAHLERSGVRVKTQRFAAGGLPNAIAAAPNLVLALGTSAARASVLASDGVPVVFAVVGDPRGAGLEGANGLPSRNASGVSASAPADRQIELLRRLVPSAKRIAILSNPQAPSAAAASLAAALQAKQLTPIAVHASGPNDVGRAISEVVDRVDAIFAVADSTIWNATSVKAAVLISLQRKKPLFGFSSGFTRAGAVASVAADDFEDIGAQAAEIARAVLDRVPIAKIAIAPPRRTSVSLNLVVAQRIGLHVESDLVDGAKVVFR